MPQRFLAVQISDIYTPCAPRGLISWQIAVDKGGFGFSGKMQEDGQPEGPEGPVTGVTGAPAPSNTPTRH